MYQAVALEAASLQVTVAAIIIIVLVINTTIKANATPRAIVTMGGTGKGMKRGSV